MGRMIRKQLNIEAEQDQGLKALSTERGVSESELVRDALTLLLRSAENERAREARTARFVQMLDEWRELSAAEPASPCEWSRDEIYDRNGRFLRHEHPVVRETRGRPGEAAAGHGSDDLSERE